MYAKPSTNGRGLSFFNYEFQRIFKMVVFTKLLFNNSGNEKSIKYFLFFLLTNAECTNNEDKIERN
jgi:hypothetical protein